VVFFFIILTDHVFCEVQAEYDKIVKGQLSLSHGPECSRMLRLLKFLDARHVKVVT